MKLRHVALVSLLALVCATGLGDAAPTREGGTIETLGQTAGTGIGCPSILNAVQHTVGVNPQYETATAGVVTSFSYLADANAGSIRALVFTKTASNSFQLVGRSAVQTVTTGTLNTFTTRIPVPAHALLGSQLSSTSMRCFIQATSSGDEVKAGAFDPDSSSTMTTSGSYTGRLNISAVVESDADADGYGDVTQDQCPTEASTHTACAGAGAPETTVTKAPQKKSFKRKAKIRFTSSVDGSTFTCKLDKKKAKPCTSPFRKKIKYGKHTVVITAASPTGTADPTPAVVRFKVEKPVG